MKVKVKICGIRSIESARVAVEAGADFIGLNFVDSSQRHISKEQAKKIINQIKGKIKTVGIFQNSNIDFVNSYIKALGLDFVQLHGEEKPKFIVQVNSKIIKAIKVMPNTDINETISNMGNLPVEYFLLDRVIQGRGEMIDLEKAKIIAEKFPIFLAGGLTPDNIAEIVKKVKPFAVDVAGGIETNGKEDPEKIIKFISCAKGAMR